jgi:hypothetical protein
MFIVLVILVRRIGQRPELRAGGGRYFAMRLFSQRSANPIRTFGLTFCFPCHWVDVIRGVDTVNDPSNGGTTQVSNLGQYHFTDRFGNCRTTDDLNYTPEKAGEVGSWQLMTAAQ